MAVVHNCEGSLLARAMQAALFSHSSVSPPLLTFLQTLLNLNESVEVHDIVDLASNNDFDSEKLMELLFSAHVNASLSKHKKFSSTVLRLTTGQNALLSNGKVCMQFSSQDVMSSILIL